MITGALLRGVVFQSLAYGGIVVMGLAGAPLLVSRRLTRWWCGLYCRYVLALARFICGLRTRIDGPVPAGEVVVAAKHQSMLDVFMLYHALPRARFVMKRELVRVPIFGLYALRIGSTPVDRAAKGAGERMLEEIEGTADPDGRGQIVIYPQGTRVAPGARAPFRRGAIRAYERFGLPMVLAATNTGVFWPRRGWAIRPGTAVVAFGETLPPGLPAPEVARRMEQGIERESARLEDEALAALGLPPLTRGTEPGAA